MQSSSFVKRLLRKKKPEPKNTSISGKWGETQAKRCLKKKGYCILGQRVRVGRRDELDLVVTKDDTLVFVEVKTRKSEAYGRPLSFVRKSKQSVISRAAVRYLKELRSPPPYLRFDVIEVIGEPSRGKPEIRHIEDAFQLDRRYDI